MVCRHQYRSGSSLAADIDDLARRYPECGSYTGNPLVNQQGIVTIYAFSIVSTISDTNITTASIILVTPYGDISRGGSVTNSFWVTLNSGTSWDINIGANLPSDIDFSYHILKY